MPTPKQSIYRNFRYPIRLALRMVQRANVQSIWPLVQAAGTLAAKPLNHIASQWENIKVEGQESNSQLLVVGLPRSGTTLVSQLLAQYLDVSYFPNVSAMFPDAPIWATQRYLGQFERPPRSNKSFYGNTVGLGGINDGFHIWNRWLGDNRYCIDHIPNEEEAIELAAFFACWGATFKRPLLNKNNRNVDGIELLSQLLPNSFFVVVQRDLVLTVQSLLAARKFVQGADSIGWGLYSDRCDAGSDAIDSTCQQVAIGQHCMKDQLSKAERGRYIEVSYEELCSSPESVVAGIADFVPCVSMRSSRGSFPALQASTTVSLSKRDHQRVMENLRGRGLEP